MKTKPDMGFWQLWNLSFGFFGVQIAYALQSSQVSRIFSTIGADPHSLSFFWILPPLMGMLVQPIIGNASDRTWNRFGRRLPYLIIGAVAAIIVMCFLPNAGSLGLGTTPTWLMGFSSAIIFGLVMLMLLDTTINMAMQPFKMLVGDMVNEKQKGLAYSIQSFLCNAGSFVGYLAPIILALFLSNEAPDGEVPATVIWAFYLGAAILLFCVFYTFAKVKEWPPQLYAEYNGQPEEPAKGAKKEGMLKQMFSALKTAPKVFWTIGLVQFFCWACFLFMWTYSTETVAIRCFDTPVRNEMKSVIINGQEFSGKCILADGDIVVKGGLLAVEQVTVNGKVYNTDMGKVTIEDQNEKKIIADGLFTDNKDYEFTATRGEKGDKVTIKTKVDGQTKPQEEKVTLTEPIAINTVITTITNDNKFEISKEITDNSEVKGKHIAIQGEILPATTAAELQQGMQQECKLNYSSKEYQEAGNWNGVVLAVQAVVAVLWAALLPRFRNRRFAYSVSLVIGAIGFISTMVLTNKIAICVSYGLMGCGWAAMLAMPFTILTNALSGKNIGTYLGLFNCTICLPQIVASLTGGLILGLIGNGANGAANTPMMLVVGGVLMLIGAACVWVIKETSGQDSAAGAIDAEHQAKLSAEEDL